MATIKLTKKEIEKLPAPHPDGRQTLYWDTNLRGFGVLCSGKTNSKTFVVQRDLPNGRTRRVTIGATNVFTELDDARAAAERILAEMYLGNDPKAGRRGAANITLRNVLDDYLTARKDLRDKSRKDYRAVIETHLEAWLDRPLREITPEMVESRHREIQSAIAARAEQDRKRREALAPAKALAHTVEGAGLKGDDAKPLRAALRNLRAAMAEGEPSTVLSKTRTLEHAAIKAGIIKPDEAAKAAPAATGAILTTGKASANGTMRALRVLWNFAAERVTGLPANPVARLRRQWFAVERRERTVRSEELPPFYKAVRALENASARDYLTLLLFTGLRRSEAATLRWDDIDFAEQVIRLPAKRTKSGRRLDLPMTDHVHALLVARRALGKDGEFVFPADSKAGHIAEPKFPLAEVAETCGVRVSAHDLRRTFITIAEGTDISPLALKGLVNHSLGNDVTSGYVQMSAERLREPAQRVADRLKMLCGIAPVTTGKIKKMQRAAV